MEHVAALRSRPRTGRAMLRARSAAAVVAAGLLVPSLVGSRAAEAAPPSLPGPSLEQVDAAIASAQGYLDGLYKPLSDGQAVQSEDYGLPLRVYFPAYRQWVLLGQGKPGDCVISCSGATSIAPLTSSETAESYAVSFSSPSKPNALRFTVSLDWAAAPGKFSVSVSGTELSDPSSDAQLWLDDDQLGTYSPGVAEAPITRTYPTSARNRMRSLRYTVRHATQEAFLYAQGLGDSDRSEALAAFLRVNGFTPGVDLRATIFGAGSALPDDLPFTTSGPDNAYADCGHLPPPGPTAYPYASKICALGVDTFLLAGRRDPFLQATEALQTLTKDGDPQRNYPPLIAVGLDGGTPAATADHLEKLWSTLGYGVPTCTPLECESGRASGLRSFVFGSLETTLGYTYGQTERRQYADAVAAQAVAVQIPSSGAVRMASGTLVRPMQAGAFPTYWDDGHRFVPTTGFPQLANDMLSMPPEYAGPIVSDSETTFDGYAFLLTYRCARFGVGCHGPA